MTILASKLLGNPINESGTKEARGAQAGRELKSRGNNPHAFQVSSERKALIL
jgi:hypothetical protein